MLTRLQTLLAPHWITIRVVGTFMGLIFVSFMAMEWRPLAERFDVAWTLARMIAKLSGWFLIGLGHVANFPVITDGTRLASGDFVVDVSPACSGAVPTMIYLAAVIAYPSTWRAKLIGTGIGLSVIHGANLARVIGLFLIGLFANQYFHDTHVYVAQSLVVGLAVATWLFWAGRFANAPGR